MFPDRIESATAPLDRSRGHGLALDGHKLVTQLGHALLELVVALVEFGQAVGPGRA